MQALIKEKMHIKQMSCKIFLIGIMQKFLKRLLVLHTSVVCCHTFGSGNQQPPRNFALFLKPYDAVYQARVVMSHLW